MRLKNLLTFLVLLSVSLGMRAADISGTGISGATDNSSGKKVQTLVINTPGALATWVAAHTGDNYDTNNPFGGLGGDNDFYSLKISGELNAKDLAALNSNTCAAFSRFPRIDMSEVTLAEETTSKDVCSVVFGPASFQKNNETITGNGATYVRLPNSMTSAEDVAEMAKMKDGGKNPNLKMVGAYDPDNQDKSDSSKKWAEVALHSFVANNVSNFFTQMNVPTSGNPTSNEPNQNPSYRKINLSGEYDLLDIDNNGPVFGWNTSAEWDFTGAHFADCTIPASTAKYYSYDNPFCEPDVLVAPSTSSNVFYHFASFGYFKKAVNLKLPDVNMTHLPKGVLYELAKENENGYKAIYGEAAFNANRETGEGVPLETLVIPDCYTDIDEGAGELARIRHLVVGSGMKRIHGGAFLGCPFLEDLDFAAGLSDCYIGDRSFNECRSMKHIALSEGIVSLGNGCFWNSQHLESIRLPQTLINIGNHAFDNCLALNSITIPENVNKIGKAAFNLCPFTDIYLTTTNPAKIPLVWSAGTKFTSFDGNCSFYHGHLDGWEGGVDEYKNDINNKMTWDEAAAFYFTHWNGMPTLHFPSQLAEKVRSSISSRYAMKTKAEDGKQYGLPLRRDMAKRDNIPGADLGSDGAGKYTRDGWAQFMMMKEFTFDPGSDVYQKEYDDVWYTMCFPFDLTDEQLAAAFNETFNIVDFSGVEVMKKDDPKNKTGNLTLTLHFNTVAKTTYKDVENNVYTRKMNADGTPFREKDGNFSYNVYTDKNGVEYHHVITSSYLNSNKTKTFAPGTSLADALTHIDQAIIIDGVLAEAGHPYMIHPAIGVNDGGTNKRKCTFSGIDWLPQSQWAPTFEAKKREVNLGEAKYNKEFAYDDDPKTWEPDDDNYLQLPYTDYNGQTYTFIGNATEYIASAQQEIGNEPEVPEEPFLPEKLTAAEVEALKPSTTVDNPGTAPQNPDKMEVYQDVKDLFNTVRVTVTGWDPIVGDHVFGEEYTYLYDLTHYTIDEFFTHYHNWEYRTAGSNHGQNATFNQAGLNAFKEYFKDVFNGDYYNNSPEERFAELKELAVGYQEALEKSSKYIDDLDAYLANQAAWTLYNQKLYELNNWSAVEAEYNTKKDEYDTKKRAHDAWIENAKKYLTLIPTGAYFLGRKANEYPRYYREIANDQRPIDERKGGYWSQFTAVIIPNDAAINGIEKELGPGVAQNIKGLNMVFDEAFMGEFEATEIKDIVADAEEKGQKVEYMNIVYSINGEVVGRGSHSLSNLPQGMYIINGKKYLVK